MTNPSARPSPASQKFTIRAQSAADPTYLQIHDNAFFHVKTTEEGGFEYGRRFLKLDVEFGGKTMQTITLVLYKQIDSGPVCGRPRHGGLSVYH